MGWEAESTRQGRLSTGVHEKLKDIPFGWNTDHVVMATKMTMDTARSWMVLNIMVRKPKVKENAK